jgi:hypothetical protein
MNSETGTEEIKAEMYNPAHTIFQMFILSLHASLAMISFVADTAL